MKRALQCLEDRIRIHEHERARLVALRDRLQADDDTVANLSAILTTDANELVEATMRPVPKFTHTTKP